MTQRIPGLLQFQNMLLLGDYAVEHGRASQCVGVRLRSRCRGGNRRAYVRPGATTQRVRGLKLIGMADYGLPGQDLLVVGFGGQNIEWQ